MFGFIFSVTQRRTHQNDEQYSIPAHLQTAQVSTNNNNNSTHQITTDSPTKDLQWCSQNKILPYKQPNEN